MKKKYFCMIWVLMSLLVVTAPALFAGEEAAQAAEKVKVEQVDQGKILAADDWKSVYENRELDEGFMGILKTKVDGSLRIDVYLGFWCSDSKQHVPVFYKIIENLENNDMKVNYYACERKPNKEMKYFVEDVKVERVPTFIFYRDDKEIGRIVETPKTDLLEDFLQIVF